MGETLVNSYENYLREVFREQRENPHLRRGQAYFNVLHDIHPELADAVRGTELDPYYNDNVAPFLIYVFTNWPSDLSEGEREGDGSS